MEKDPLYFRLELSESQTRVQTLIRKVTEMYDWSVDRDRHRLGVSLADKDGALGLCRGIFPRGTHLRVAYSHH